MKSLIIGKGQIGSALFEILSKVYDVQIRDVEPEEMNGVQVLHIAFPYSEHFVSWVKTYIRMYRPRLTIIHSTVAIGTTEECGDHVLHAPERGRFPNLAREMICYKKFIGGFDITDLDMAANYFKACKWETMIVDDPKITESLKLISNAHMGLEIAWRQELAHWGVDKEVYQLWEDSYFQGYLYLGQGHLARSRMKADPIGGHCILQSVDILKQNMHNSPFLDLIKETNERTQRKEEAEAVHQHNGNGHAEVSTLR